MLIREYTSNLKANAVSFAQLASETGGRELLKKSVTSGQNFKEIG